MSVQIIEFKRYFSETEAEKLVSSAAKKRKWQYFQMAKSKTLILEKAIKFQKLKLFWEGFV